jgi:hypothetical protein
MAGAVTSDLARAFEERGIFVRRPDQVGEHRAPCPECDRGPRDDALAVRIDGEGATWICHRCEWRGGIRPRRSGRHDRLTPRRREPQLEPERIRSPERLLGQVDWRLPVKPDPNTAYAKQIWAESTALSGTAAEAYLRHRGLWGRDPASTVMEFYPWAKLRFHPRCRLPEDIRHELKHAASPALIVAINGPLGNLVAVQRVFLTEDGRKAPVAKPKRTLGPVKHGAARLADWRAADTLALTEGVEDALAYMRLTATPTWAACGSGTMGSTTLPLAIRNVVIVADADAPGMKAAGEAYRAFTSQGRNVRVVRAIGAKDPAEIVGRVA